VDDEFYRERAKHIRELSTQADPFIKKRLLRLANNYDDMIVGKGRPPNPPGDTAVIPPDAAQEAES
jgi:hypothetical protein